MPGGRQVWPSSTSGPTLNRMEYRDANLSELEPDGRCRFWSIGRLERSGAVFYLSHWKRLNCDEITTQSTDLRPSEFAPSWAGLRMPPTTDYWHLPEFAIRTVHAFGWPLLSMWQDYVYTGDGYRSRLGHGLQLDIPPPDPDDAFPRAIPLRPIWLGFAVNTLFYAAVLWLLIPGPFALRRFIRRRRGLCPGCGYPAGGSEVCSECGKPLGTTIIASCGPRKEDIPS